MSPHPVHQPPLPRHALLCLYKDLIYSLSYQIRLYQSEHKALGLLARFISVHFHFFYLFLHTYISPYIRFSFGCLESFFLLLILLLNCNQGFHFVEREDGVQMRAGWGGGLQMRHRVRVEDPWGKMRSLGGTFRLRCRSYIHGDYPETSGVR